METLMSLVFVLLLAGLVAADILDVLQAHRLSRFGRSGLPPLLRRKDN